MPDNKGQQSGNRPIETDEERMRRERTEREKKQNPNRENREDEDMGQDEEGTGI